MQKHLRFLQVFPQDHPCAQSQEDRHFLCTAHYTSEPVRKQSCQLRRSRLKTKHSV